MMSSSKKGASAHQLVRTLGLGSYRTAWFMCHRIREAMRDGMFSTPPLGGKGKVVEADETYIGRKPGRRVRPGPSHKHVVLSPVERGGKARSFHISGTKLDVVMPIVKRNIDKESRLATDEAMRIVVPHSVAGVFPREESPEVNARLTLYCNLMEEIKSRLAVLGTIFKPAAADLFPQVALGEFSYLELRVVCELIAVATLVAHGDIPATKTGKLQKSYEADKIVHALEKIHPNFYPQPSKQLVNDKGEPTGAEPILSGYLTKHELRKLYAECAEFLHRGSAKSVQSGKLKTLDFQRVADWGTKICTLLNHHHITLLNASQEFWVSMQTEGTGAVTARHMYVVRIPLRPKP